MEVNFLINDYNLIWNILFQASINDKVHLLKQKMWNNYKDTYSKTYKDNALILADYKNFIPNDDTIYNMMMDNELYLNIKKRTEKYRLELLKLWNEHKKGINNILDNVLRIKLEDVNVLVVDPRLDNFDLTAIRNNINTITWSKPINKDDKIKSLSILLYCIASKLVLKYKKEDQFIARAVIELAIVNELPTRMSNRSYYLTGSSELQQLKRQIYPYFLMYLGVRKEHMMEYMRRDK